MAWGDRNVKDFQKELWKRSSDFDVLSKERTARGKEILGGGLDVVGKGLDVFGRGVETLGQPLSYYQGLLGNRQEALTAASPEISTIHGQFDTAAKAVSEFSPRGGGRVQASAELPFLKQAAIQDVITKQRPEAAKGVTGIAKLLADLGLAESGIGAMLSQLGLSEEQLGISEEQLSLQALLGGVGVAQSESARKSALAGNLGKAAGSVIAGVLI